MHNGMAVLNVRRHDVSIQPLVRNGQACTPGNKKGKESVASISVVALLLLLHMLAL